MPDHNYFANLIWQIADLLRGPYRPPQYERVMLPMTVLRRFDCVLAPTKTKVLAEHERRQGGRLNDDALDRILNNAAGQRFHNHSPLDFLRLKGDPDHIAEHLVSYIKGFSANVRTIFDFFEFDTEIDKMREANILYLVVSKFCDVDLHPNTVPNDQMGLIFENLIRRFNELANETAGDHFTPREVIRLMVNILFIQDDQLLATPGTVRKLLDPACLRHRRHAGRGAELPARAPLGGQALCLWAGLQQACLRHGCLRHAHEAGRPQRRRR
jgi:type I restriction enzyme M protein